MDYLAWALFFCVDARASERFVEAKKELDALMWIKEIEDVLVLVLGNKTDKVELLRRKCWDGLWS